MLIYYIYFILKYKKNVNMFDLLLHFHIINKKYKDVDYLNFKINSNTNLIPILKYNIYHNLIRFFKNINNVNYLYINFNYFLLLNLQHSSYCVKSIKLNNTYVNNKLLYYNHKYKLYYFLKNTNRFSFNYI